MRRLSFERFEDRILLAIGPPVAVPTLTMTFTNTDTIRVDGTEVTASEFSFSDTVNVEVLPDQAADDSYTLDEDTTLFIPAPGVLENDTGVLDVVLIAGPANGHALLGADGSLIYIPDHDFFGDDHLVYGADGLSALVTLSVANVNDLPTTVDDFSQTREDEATVIGSVLLNDSDPDGDPLSIESFTQPANGVAVHEGDGIFTYTPNPDYFGTDTFEYTATDGNGGTGTATVTIEVAAVNDAPVAVDDAYLVRVDGALPVHSNEGTLSNDYDPDSDAIVAVVVTVQPTHGGLTIDPSSGAFLYIPDPGYVGPDSFEYKVSDGQLWSAPALVSIEIVASNLPLVRSEVYLSGPAGITIDAAMGVLANDSPAGLVVTLVVEPLHGILVLAADGSFAYSPNVGFVGADPFTYRGTTADGLFVAEAQSAFWVDAPPSSPGNQTAGIPDQPALGGGSIYDVALFGQQEAQKRAWLDGPILPAAVDAVMQQGV